MPLKGKNINNMTTSAHYTYRTVPITASVPEYGASTFHVKDKDSSNMEAALRWKEIKNLNVKEHFRWKAHASKPHKDNGAVWKGLQGEKE